MTTEEKHGEHVITEENPGHHHPIDGRIPDPHLDLQARRSSRDWDFNPCDPIVELDLEHQVSLLRSQIDAMRPVIEIAKKIAQEVESPDRVDNTDIVDMCRDLATSLRSGRRAHPELGIAGFTRIGRIDAAGRRSLWMHVKDPPGADPRAYHVGEITLRAGREGDDAQVVVPVTSPLHSKLYDVLSCARFAADWEDPMGCALEVDVYGGRNLVVAAQTGIDLLRALDADPAAPIFPSFAPIARDPWVTHVAALRRAESHRMIFERDVHVGEHPDRGEPAAQSQVGRQALAPLENARVLDGDGWMPSNVNVRMALSSTALAPTRSSAGSSGYDLCAPSDVIVRAGRLVVIYTGVCLEIPDTWEAQVWPLPAMMQRGLLASLGTVDADYRGEVSVWMTNVSGEDAKVRRGEQIAHLVFARVDHPTFELVTELSITERQRG